ncbi:MAG: segregation/condensation protein A [Rhodocyclaceae bacterium]|nr:segregation/condensation protein A [Rhodocyclaceae bacterium]MBX3666994.1 segregation/condensation protein A [Rhodocyclaceae bacterium]
MNVAADLPVVARLYGEPLVKLPADLYIPPDALEIILDAFEGPLDLLLYLIRKANINILDIPMAPLTAQYLEYVEAMRRVNLDLAADYLAMAAMLLEIKSRLLLPRPSAVAEDDAQDPRAELVARLLEYERIKRAGQELDALPQATRNFEWTKVWFDAELVERLPDVIARDLQMAWLNILRQARNLRHHKVTREQLSVREYMGHLLRRLQAGKVLRFEDLFEVGAGAPEVVVNFLALLELARESLVLITQSEAFCPIYIALADGGSEQPYA